MTEMLETNSSVINNLVFYRDGNGDLYIDGRFCISTEGPNDSTRDSYDKCKPLLTVKFTKFDVGTTKVNLTNMCALLLDNNIERMYCNGGCVDVTKEPGTISDDEDKLRVLKIIKAFETYIIGMN